MFTYDYPRHVVTTDAVIVYQGSILLIKRKNEPFKNCWALPGGFLDEGETTAQGCIREVLEETNLDLSNNMTRLIGVYDKPNRDPRNLIAISHAFKFVATNIENLKAQDDAIDFMWLNMTDYRANPDMIELAFDHKDIIQDAFYM